MQNSGKRLTRTASTWRMAMVGAAFIIGGCISATVVPTGEAHFESRAKDHPIDIYLPDDAPVKVLKAAGTYKSPTRVPASASVIGRMDVDGDQNVGWTTVVKRAQREARKLGGDAILFQGAGTPLTGSSGAGAPIAGTSVSWFGASASYGKSITVAVLRYEGSPANEGVSPGR